jgi:hypothetical protein
VDRSSNRLCFGSGIIGWYDSFIRDTGNVGYGQSECSSVECYVECECNWVQCNPDFYSGDCCCSFTWYGSNESGV